MSENWHKLLALAALVLLCTCQQRTLHRETSHAVFTEEARVFAEALGSQDAKAVEPWFRAGQTISVHRICPDCAAESRRRSSAIQNGEGFLQLAAKLNHQRNASDSTMGNFVFGNITCEKFCCKYETGLLDHATTYLVKACFARDPKGLAVTTLELLDG